MHIIKYHNKHNNYFKKIDEEILKDDTLNLDSDSSEEPPSQSSHSVKIVVNALIVDDDQISENIARQTP